MPKIRVYNPRTKSYEEISQREISKRTAKSSQWFRNTVQGQFARRRAPGAPAAQSSITNEPQTDRRVRGNSTLSDPEFKKNLRKVVKPLPGRMYMYVYDPKHKKTLPYYDVFPLIFMTDLYDDGFLGLNMHYLPYLLRARLMEELIIHTSDVIRKGKPEKQLAISYQILKSASANKYFQPTIKRYLSEHIRSPLIEVLEPQWENAVFLPTDQFRKKSKSEVWQESRRKLK